LGALATERRLAAVLAADVVGYSRMMGRDESGTLAVLKAHLRERFEPALARHRGRLVKLTGDGALAEFRSAVDALDAAIEFQQAMLEANRDQPDDRRIVFRIGLHLGDLIVDDDDLYGDGVNVAARLQAEAPEGGILVSRAIHEVVAGRLKATFMDLGELTLKNIDCPVRAFRPAWDAADFPVASLPASPTAQPPPPAPSVADARLALPDKPSLVVLPFQNMSGDPEQEYFVDGLVEDITSALSRIRQLFVIARGSAFTYKGRALDVRQVGRELGVRYVLEGSVRKSGTRLRITGQLIDAEDGAHLWANHYDGQLDEVFELQDRITASVAGAIEPHLQRAEIRRARRKATTDLGAYDYYLRGVSLLITDARTHWAEAASMFREAFALDPEYGVAYAVAAMCVYHHKMHGVVAPTEAEIAEGVRLARLGVMKGAHDARALAFAGFALTYLAGDVEGGLRLTERACALNPNCYPAWECAGWNRLYSGDPNAAIADFEQALRLSPRDVGVVAVETGIARAHFNAGRYDLAVAWSERAISSWPDSTVARRLMAAAYAQAGRMDDARRAIADLLALEPEARLARRRSAAGPWRRPDDYERWFDGLRRAGMPE
jgi:adenylate cyclase